MKTQALVRPVLAIVCALGACPAQQESGLPRTRAYDVRDIARREPQFLPAASVDASYMPTVHDVGEDPTAALELADLAELVKMGTGPSNWEQEGVELRLEDSGFLSLTCDDEMHTKVRSLLARLRRQLFEPVLVEVHALPGAALAGRGAVLSAEATDALLAAAGEHPVYMGRANPRRPLLLEAKRIQNRIAGMRMMVAQSASAPDLEVAVENYGPSWTVWAGRTVGDAMLVTISGSERSLEAGPTLRLPTGDGKTATTELAVTRIAACHASSYLRPGQAMLVGSDAPGAVVLCVRVRPTGPAAPAELGELTAYPVANLVRGPVRPQPLRVPYEDGTLFPESDDEPMPPVFDDGRLQEWLKSQVAPETWDGSPNRLCYVGGVVMVGADAQTQAGVLERLQSLQAIDARQFSLEVGFGEVPADLRPALPGVGAERLAAALPNHCVATVSASREARVAATWHTPSVKDSDAVIASGSAVTAANLGSIARGFLLRGNVAPMDQGTVLLDLQMSLLAHGGERSVFDLQDPRLAQVDRIDVREHKVRGATVVALGEWTLLQLCPIDGGKGHVAVVARLRAM